MRGLLKTLEVDNYRAISKLTIGGFGRVNLITGKNNVGKSSLLEAIRILATDGGLVELLKIMEYREEAGLLRSDTSASFKPTYLFRGFPEVSQCQAVIRIAGEISDKEMYSVVELKLEPAPSQQSLDLLSAVENDPSESRFDDSVSAYSLIVSSSSGERRLDLSELRRGVRFLDGRKPLVPCIFVDPYSSRPTGKLAAMWDDIALTDSEPVVLNALKVVCTDIERITWVGDDGAMFRGNSAGRKAIVKSRQHAFPVPLRSFGDGLNRWLGILISLAAARDGYVLVDEIETGIHYSVQRELWQAIFQVATRLNVQVFATTHSWDTIQAFQNAAASSPEEGVLFRLTEKGGTLHSTRFSQEELQIVSRDNIEVR